MLAATTAMSSGSLESWAEYARYIVRVGKEEFRLALFEDALVAFVPEFRVFPNLVLSGRGPAGPELQDLLYRGLRDQFAGCRATRPAFRKTRTPTQRKMVSKRSCGTAKRCETKTSDAMRVFECLAEEVSRSSRALMCSDHCAADGMKKGNSL